MAAVAVATLAGVVPIVPPTSLAMLVTAATMVPPRTQTDWMVALAVATLDGAAPIAAPTSLARLPPIALPMVLPRT